MCRDCCVERDAAYEERVAVRVRFILVAVSARKGIAWAQTKAMGGKNVDDDNSRRIVESVVKETSEKHGYNTH